MSQTHLLCSSKTVSRQQSGLWSGKCNSSLRETHSYWPAQASSRCLRALPLPPGAAAAREAADIWLQGGCEPNVRDELQKTESPTSHCHWPRAVPGNHHLLLPLAHGGGALAGFGRVSSRTNGL